MFLFRKTIKCPQPEAIFRPVSAPTQIFIPEILNLLVWLTIAGFLEPEPNGAFLKRLRSRNQPGTGTFLNFLFSTEFLFLSMISYPFFKKFSGVSLV